MCCIESEMNRIFREGLYTRCVIYVDDILVFGKTREEHDANLQWVLEKCKEWNVKIKLEKCTFAQTAVKYLGFNITGTSISPLKERLEALRSDRPPRSKTELKSFTGKLNFYSRFIPNYSGMLEPLRELYRNNTDFQWKPHHQVVFEQLLSHINSAKPQLLIPRSEVKYIELHIMKDTLEAILLTKEDKLVSRASRFLEAAESNYSSVEKQLLALNLALKKFRIWLKPENFIVRVPSLGISRAMQLVDRPERVENLLLRMPCGFDSFNFEVRESLMNEVATKLKHHIPEEIYFVDGACKSNGKNDCKASWAVVAYYDTSVEQAGLVEHSPSNQSAELTAAIKACELAKSKGQTEITIVTDSKYLHNAVTQWADKWSANDWKDHRNKPVVNVDLFKQILLAKAGLQIEWIHVRGHAGVEGNIRADALARSVLCEKEVLFSIMAERRNIQEDDAELHTIKSQIRSGERQDLILDNDKVYYIDPKIQIGDAKRLYVPLTSRAFVLSLAHDNQLYGGHLGVKKTFSKLLRFWWKGMLSDVEEYVKSCTTCQSFKERPGPPPGFLHSIPVSRIFQHLHLDIVGPTISSTTRGNKYILTATDAFSKYVFARPCQSIQTSVLVDFLMEEVVARHGVPECIITDRGTQFTSSEWATAMKRMSITHKLTSAYHPQSNGIDERVNGTVIRILKSYVDRFQSNWDTELKWAVFTYNTAKHSSSGFSPYHMMHGLEPRSPFNAHLCGQDQTTNLESIREHIRRTADEINKRAQAAQKRVYDRNHQSISLKVGQRVWVKEYTCPSELSKKFHQKWLGPCIVVSVLGESDNPRAVEVLDLQFSTRKVVAIKDIKRHYERPDHLDYPQDKQLRKEGEAQAEACTEELNQYSVGDDDPSSALNGDPSHRLRNS